MKQSRKLPAPASTLRRTAILAAVALALPGADLAADIIYQNDFSTRMSANAIPYGEWREVPYAVGRLINPWSASFFAGDELQDNWILGQSSQGDAAWVVDDGNNQEALLCHTQANYAIGSVIAKQRLGNAFTTGVVTAQCDFKTPTEWQSADTRSLRFLLGDETFFSPNTASDKYMQYLAAGAGVSVYASGSTAAFKFYCYGCDLASAPAARSGVWYRTIIAADLDAKTYTVATYEMGASHPAFDAETPASPAWATNGVPFWSVTKGVSAAGISAIGIAGYGVSGTTNASDRAQAAQIDNIRVWHDGVECYANDFASRNSRNLAAGTTATAYPVTSTPVTNTLSYAIGTKLLPAVNTSADLQPVGFDGWRRLNNGSNSSIRPEVAAYTNNNAMLLDYNGNFSIYGIAAQRLGQTLSGGIVRIWVDVRIAALGDNGLVGVFLGNDAMYSGSNSGNAYNQGVFARFEITGAKNGTDANGAAKRVPRWGTSTGGAGTDSKMVSSDTGAATAAKWFRMEILADLDNGTYDANLYHLRDAAGGVPVATASGESLFSELDIPRYKALAEVSAVSLDCYYGKAYFDNLRVWYRPTGVADETLVYQNTFSTRTANGCGTTDKLVGTLAKNPIGIDAWTRLGRATDGIFLIGGNDQALGFAAVGTTAAYAAHDLGGFYRNGVMTARFDAKAPSAWETGGYGYCWLGGDQFHEGNLNGGDGVFYKWAASGAGFFGTAFAVYSGNGEGGGSFQTSGTATPGHWYRFAVKSDLTAGKSDVAVFDMGTEQPTLATPTPVSGAVATWTELPFRRSPQSLGGVSCLSVSAKGVKEANPLVSTDSRLLFDNFAVEFSPAAFVIIMR